MICKNCEIEFERKGAKRRNIFCSIKCSNDFNNRERAGNKMTSEQKNKISNSIKKRREEFSWKYPRGEGHSKNVGEGTREKYKGRINSILEVSSRTTMKILKRLELGCCICGWKEGSCDVHHIRGRKIQNCNDHSNLTYLCPNHHRLAHEKKLTIEEMIPLSIFLPSNWNEKYYG